MALEKQNVLFFTRTMRLGGTENVVLQMCDILNKRLNRVVVCSCGGVNVEKLNQMGIKHYEIPDIEKKNPVIILQVIITLLKIIRKEKINIIHVHHRMAAFYTKLIKPFMKIQFVATSHGIFSDKVELTRFAYKGSKIIACGSVVKDNLVNYFGLDDHHIQVIHNAILKDEAPIVPIEELKCISEQEKKVGYIGRLSEEKGIRDLMQIMSLVQVQNSKIKFVIAGDGSLTGELQKYIYEHQLEESVIMLGYRNDAQNVIKQMDIIVLPSLTEGLPLTPIEAFAHGKPVVATKAGGTVEIVRDLENGYLTEIGDVEMFAQKVCTLCEDESIYNLFAQNAKNDFESCFSYTMFENEIISFYEQL